jgi:hypothetical protein
MARAILTVLAGRGVEAPETARDRITTCTSVEQVVTWLLRASTADTLDDVFAE